MATIHRRDSKIIDTFSETRYEDEPHILDTEVKDAIKHISNRKSSGCDGIPRASESRWRCIYKNTVNSFNNIWRTKEWQ